MPRNTKRGSLGSCDVCEMSDQGNPRPPEPGAKPDAVALEPDAVALEPDGLPRGLRWLKEHLYHVSKIGADLLIDSGYLFAHKRF